MRPVPPVSLRSRVCLNTAGMVPAVPFALMSGRFSRNAFREQRASFLLALCVFASCFGFAELRELFFVQTLPPPSASPPRQHTSTRLIQPQQHRGNCIAAKFASGFFPKLRAGPRDSASLLRLRMAEDGDVPEQEDTKKKIQDLLAERMDERDQRNFNLQTMSREDRRKYEKMGEALMDAVREGDAELVTELCTEGKKGILADPEYVDEFGFGPLHLAAKRGDIAVLNALIAAGADVNLGGEGGTVPLHFAAQAGQLDAVKRLVGLGGDVDYKDNTQSTPLRMAQAFNHKDVEAYLRPLQGTGSGQWTKLDDNPDLLDMFEDGFAKALEEELENNPTPYVETIDTTAVEAYGEEFASEERSGNVWDPLPTPNNTATQRFDYWSVDSESFENEFGTEEELLAQEDTSNLTNPVASLEELLEELDPSLVADLRQSASIADDNELVDALLQKLETEQQEWSPEAEEAAPASASREGSASRELSEYTLEELQAEVERRRKTALGDEKPSEMLMKEIDDMLLAGEEEKRKEDGQQSDEA